MDFDNNITDIHLAPFASDTVAVERLLINGVACSPSAVETVLKSDDVLEVTFTADYFHPLTITGNVKELLKDGVVTRRGDNFHLVAPRLKPLRYYLALEADGCSAELLAKHVKISGKSSGAIYPVSSDKGYVFVIDGPAVAAEFQIAVMPDERSRDSIAVGRCVPAALISRDAPLVVKAKTIKPEIIIPEGETPSIVADIVMDALTVKVPVEPGCVIVVPTAAEVRLKSADGTIEKTGRGYEFVPSAAWFRLIMPSCLDSANSGLRHLVVCGGREYSYEGKVRLPLEDVNAGDMKLKCVAGGKSFTLPLIPLGRNLEISGTLIVNDSPHEVQCMADNSVLKLAPYSLKSYENTVTVSAVVESLPADTDLSSNRVGRLDVYTFAPDAIAPADEDTRSDYFTGHDVSKEDSVQVTFEGCGDYMVEGKMLADGQQSPIDRQRGVVITDANGQEVASFQFDTLPHNDGAFTIDGSGKNFTIKYHPTLFSRMLQTVAGKVMVGLGIAMVVALLALFMWLLLSDSSTPEPSSDATAPAVELTITDESGAVSPDNQQ